MPPSPKLDQQLHLQPNEPSVTFSAFSSTFGPIATRFVHVSRASPFNASSILLALHLVIGPLGICEASLGFGCTACWVASLPLRYGMQKQKLAD